MASRVHIGKIARPIPACPLHQHEDTSEIVLYAYDRGVARIGRDPIPFRKRKIICRPQGVSQEEVSEQRYTNICMHVRDLGRFDGVVPVYQDQKDRPFFRIASLLLLEGRLCLSRSKARSKRHIHWIRNCGAPKSTTKRAP